MLKTILKLSALSLTLVRFDTQDNLVKTAFDNNWAQSVNLDTFEPLQEFAIWRHSPTKMWFKSKTPVKAVFLNNFPYWYKVKRVSLYHYVTKLISIFAIIKFFRPFLYGARFLNVLQPKGRYNVFT